MKLVNIGKRTIAGIAPKDVADVKDAEAKKLMEMYPKEFVKAGSVSVVQSADVKAIKAENKKLVAKVADLEAELATANSLLEEATKAPEGEEEAK